MHVAIFGGSFNPPHVGHLLAAQYVHATLQVDEVWLIPSSVHPFGKPLAAFEHRLKMCELLCEETSGWLRVSDVEDRLKGEGRTVDTLAHLKAQYAQHQFSLVIGSDILKDLPHWKDVERIRELAKIIVLHRAGFDAPEALGPPLAQVSSTEIRERLARGNDAVQLVPRRVVEYAKQNRLYEGV